MVDFSVESDIEARLKYCCVCGAIDPAFADISNDMGMCLKHSIFWRFVDGEKRVYELSSERLRTIAQLVNDARSDYAQATLAILEQLGTERPH